MALAHSITFTTYGARLHGSIRALVDDEQTSMGRPSSKRTTSAVNAKARLSMAEPAHTLNAAARCSLAEPSSTSRRSARLSWAAHVRTNDAHVVVNGRSRSRWVMSDMKAGPSRESTLAYFGTVGRHRWTRHGTPSDTVPTRGGLVNICYTLDGQGPRMA